MFKHNTFLCKGNHCSYKLSASFAYLVVTPRFRIHTCDNCTAEIIGSLRRIVILLISQATVIIVIAGKEPQSSCKSFWYQSSPLICIPNGKEPRLFFLAMHDLLSLRFIHDSHTFAEPLSQMSFRDC